MYKLLYDERSLRTVEALGKKCVAVVTPGTFAIPSTRSSSVEKVVVEVTNRLKKEVDFLIIGKRTRGLAALEKKNGMTYYRPAYTNRKQYLMRAAEKIQQMNAHIIQVENRPRYAAFLKQRFPHKKVWLTLHSMTYMSQPHMSHKEFRRCVSVVDKVIVNSHFLKGRVVAAVPQCAHKIEVIHLGVSQRQFISKWSSEGINVRATLANQLGYKHKQVILYVGRLIAIKGVHHLLKVMPHIIKKYPDAVLVVVGSAFYGKNTVTPYVSKLHQLGNAMPRNVRFIPFVPSNLIHRWYCLADIVVVPSFENEAFGLVNVEAMSCGVPVVATNSGGIKEIVEHGKTGLMISPSRIDTELERALLDLLAHPRKRKQMGEASQRRIASHFTWQHTARRFYEAYVR